MQVGAGEPADPIARGVAAGVAEHLSARRHALLNSSGNVESEASSTPSARKPFQVKATVTQRLSFSTVARIAAAECTVSLIADSHARGRRRLPETREIRSAR